MKVLISLLGSLIFLGGWIWPVSIFTDDVPAVVQALLMLVKTFAFIVFFMWMRASLPAPRCPTQHRRLLLRPAMQARRGAALRHGGRCCSP